MVKKHSLWVFIIILLFVGYYIQTQLWISGDVGYLLHASAQMLKGGRYATDIFETNPPMILYLYSPAVWLSQLMPMNIISSIRLTVFLLGLLSIGLAYLLLKQWIDRSYRGLFNMIIITLGFVFFILPLQSFAQREHLLMMLIVPYLFVCVLRLENKIVHPSFALVAGLLSGLGFSLKPFFLIPLCLIEGFLIVKKRSLFSVIRIESIAIAFVLILYFFSIILFQPNYITVILPLVLTYYFPYAKQSWINLFSPPYVLFCLGMMISYFFCASYFYYQNLGRIILIGLIGFVLVFITERTSWYYHVYPALALAYLLAAYYLGQLFSWDIKKNDRYLLLGPIFLILNVPIYNALVMVQYWIYYRGTHPMNTLAELINRYPGKHAIACMPFGTGDCFPLVYMTNSQYAARFPSLWWFKGLRQFDNYPIRSPKINKDKDYLIDCVANDLKNFKARWVIFNNAIFQANDLITYFSENKSFREAWQHYRYLTTIATYPVFERVD